MISGKYDFIVEEGSTFDEYVIWKDKDGNAHDVTGYTAKMEIRQNKADTSAIDEVTVSVGTTDGRFDLDMTSTETRALSFNGRAFYDLEVSPGGEDCHTAADVIRILEGVITLSREVTR